MKPLSRIFSLLLCTVLVAACDKSSEQTEPVAAAPAPIILSESAVIEAGLRSLQPEFSVPAQVEAVQSAMIRPQVSSTVLANHFSAGDIVEEGQLLVELDDSRLVAELASAEAGLLAGQAAVTQAEENWKRAEELMPDGYISALDYDAAKAQVQTARADVSQAEANLQTARLNVDYTKIHAPFSGRISKPGHAVGNYVSPQTPEPLFELVQLDPIYVTAGVEISVYNRFMMTQQKLAAEGGEEQEIVVRVELSGVGEYQHEGVFEAWDHAISGSSGTIAGRTLFPNPDGLLLPGQNVTLLGEAMQAVEGVFIPQRAVFQDQQGHFVKTVDDAGVVKRVNIEVGVRDGADWSVESGIEPGDLVIVEGGQRLAPGTQVQIGSPS